MDSESKGTAFLRHFWGMENGFNSQIQMSNAFGQSYLAMLSVKPGHSEHWLIKVTREAVLVLSPDNK